VSVLCVLSGSRSSFRKKTSNTNNRETMERERERERIVLRELVCVVHRSLTTDLTDLTAD